MLHKLQRICWIDNEKFKIEDIDFVGYHCKV
jgi:hypothetical protein